MASPAERRRVHVRAGTAATLVALPGIALLLGLGAWQLYRLDWKTELIETLESRMAMAPIELPAAIDDAAALAYRRVWVEGEFRHDREMHLVGRTMNGRAGYHVVTPLERAGGPPVLVNRGWVPLDRKAPETRAKGQVEGVVRVEGIVREGGAKGLFVPENDPQGGVWFWVDLGAMGAFAGGEVPPVLVDAGPAPNPGGLPVGGQTRLEIRNEHLQYAITWFALAAALAVIYVLSRRRHRSAPPDDGPPPGSS